MIRKLFICPYFGHLPPWMPAYMHNVSKQLGPHGYDVLIDHNLKRFRARAKKLLRVECPPMFGNGKVHDFRAVLGVLYQDEIAGYDFWGHTDFDIVYGNPAAFVTDEFLAELDIHSDGWDYVNGPWTLYRNTEANARLFEAESGWRDIVEHPVTTGWVESIYADHVKDQVGSRFRITNWQTRNLDHFGSLYFRDGRLFEGSRGEVLFAHFRRTKRYPPQLIPETT